MVCQKQTSKERIKRMTRIFIKNLKDKYTKNND